MQDVIEATDAALEYVGVGGATWRVSEVPCRDVTTIMQRFGICEVVARVLATRGIPIEEMENFLFPTLRLLLPDPFHLLDMDKAVARIHDAIRNGESIAIFGDYDVDGATSSAMLCRYLRGLEVHTKIYIPDRVEEGYGPNSAAMLKLREEGYSLCITVDCGTLAYEPILAARSVNLDVIVVDHHIGINTLPKAVAVVNPNRLDESSEHTYLSAVGTSFLLLVALQKTLREAGVFAHRSEPDLMNYLDLVALGTVCDVMPMIKLNRAMVRHGLKVISARSNVGLRVLGDAIGIEEKISVYHLGFSIGPHINAGGRVGNASLGASLLSSDDESECERISYMLLSLNAERKELEKRSLEEALHQAERLVAAGNNVIMVAGTWHVGVIGIVASRLKERFHLPSIVVSLSGNLGKASARSVSGIDIGAAVLAAKLEQLIPEGGGHAMAAGFSVCADKLEALYSFFLERFKHSDIQKVSYACGILTAGAVNFPLWRELQMLEPFGPGNPEPRFILKNVEIRKPEVMGGSHVRCLISGDNALIKGVCFKCIGTELGTTLLQRGRCVHLLGKISVNQWRGNEYVQFVIDDAALP
ncbi:single-stranded-DNA-specific exonuclease RecJ [Anaplasma marginale]|uniref:single-stranded-DNA-specific exonuclease RecJ n=1 Tax=Anaplasma marginale TaxID=770 RepID=UPI000E577128|nr:single-stranded-DNA-specific exonuclease RecJ [Anaplasma marginale]AXW84366.1 single-stranded-DNA-specific exonuclease RecJ [Anaplasma marginale]